MNLKQHGVGKRFLTATLDSVSTEHFAEVHEYAHNGPALLKTGRGLLLSGNPGIGKTWALVGLMQFLFEQMGASTNRWDFHVVTAPVLFDLYAPDARTPLEDDFRNQTWKTTFETVSALVINDLGKEDRSRDWLHEAVTYKLGRVLRARHEAELPVFITTNLALQEDEDHARRGVNVPTVRSVYGESIWSLLFDLTQYRVQTVAPDQRPLRTGGESTL